MDNELKSRRVGGLEGSRAQAEMGDSWLIIVATEALLGLVEASTEWRNVARRGAMWLASLTTSGHAANQSFSLRACLRPIDGSDSNVETTQS